MSRTGPILLSVSHRTAPLAVRDRLAFDAAGQAALLADLVTVTGEAVAIVTCNRTELYGYVGDGESVGQAASLLAEHAGMTIGELAPYVERLCDDDASRHLYRVAAGLDSIVIGEPQILGQVRQAAELARAVGTIGPALSKLFNLAVVAGKRARSETPISRGAGSVSYAAVELGRSILGDLHGRRAAVIGLGEMGQLVARNLVAHGVADLVVCNRTPDRAALVARDIGGRVVPWDDLDAALTSSDIVITATGAREPVLTLCHMRSVVERRQGRPLLVIDIAVPRDVEPSVGTLPGVHLRNIDALQDVRSENLRAREEAIPQVERIVDEQVAAFNAWQRGREAVPVIRELRRRVEEIREQEVEKALRRLGHLDARDREVVQALSHGLANKLLHQPIMRLKENGGRDAYAQALADLFDLEPPSDES